MNKYNHLTHIKKIEIALINWQMIKKEYHLIKMTIDDIKLQCNYCNTIVEISIRDFNRNLNNGRNVSCSKKCELRRQKETFIKNYGVDHPCKNENVKRKLSANNGMKLDLTKKKMKETNLKKYGHQCSLHGSNKEKTKQIFIDKYGVDNPWKVPEIHAKATTPEIQKKKYLTRKKNNSFNTSKYEDQYYEKLKETFPKVIRQYKDERYPFACDFYIPELDIFIELNLHWTHGKEPFNQNNIEHQKILSDWNEKAKTSKFYKIALDVWTNKDVMKRKIAEMNNLTYIELF